MKKLIMAALTTTVILCGCDRNTGQRSDHNTPPAEAAEASSKAFGDYVVYFNAMSTDQLQAEVARMYDIARSKNRAMLSISIIRNETNGVGASVAGAVDVSAANLTGQIKNLSLRKIQEGDAIYYIGDVAVANGETLVFDIDVTPADEVETFALRFSRQFFVN